MRDIGDAFVDVTPVPERRHVRIPSLAVGAVAGLLGAAIAAVVLRPRPVADTGLRANQTVATQLTDYGASETSSALSPDGRAFVFVSNHGGTPDIWLRQIAGGEPVRLTNDPAPESELTYAPDGESVYFTRSDVDGISIWQTGVLGGRPRRILTGARAASPSPDGRQLAFQVPEGSGTNLVVRAVDSAENRILTKFLPGGAARSTWSKDGRFLSYVRSGLFAPSNLFVIDMTTGRDRQVTSFTRGNEGVVGHAWLPDNRHLVVSYVPFPRQQASADIGILDVEDASIARMTTTVQRALVAPSVSANGSRLIVTSQEFAREVWRIPAKPGEAPVRLSGPLGDPMWTFLARDGKWLVYTSLRNSRQETWRISVAGGTAEKLFDGFFRGDWRPQLAGNGTWIVTSNGLDGVRLLDVERRTVIWEVRVPSSAGLPMFSPDGRSFSLPFQAGRDRDTIGIFDTATGARQKTIDMPFRVFFRAAWIDHGSAFIVNRNANTSHIVLFDRFWSAAR